MENRQKFYLAGTIDKIYQRTDKNGKDYLVIKFLLEKENEPTTFFCFGLKKNWAELAVGKKYEIEFWKSNLDTNVISNFSKINNKP